MDPPEGAKRGRRSKASAPGREGSKRLSSHAQEDPRSRMTAAMLELVGEQGAAATTVADVIARAGASRKTFYEHFEDKQACFLASGDEVARQWMDRAQAATANADDAGEAMEAFAGTLFELALGSPAGLRMIAVELTAVGRPGIERRERILRELGQILGDALEGLAEQDEKVKNGFRLPADDPTGSLLARALTGAILRRLYSRAHRGGRTRKLRRSELAPLTTDVARWMASFRFIPEPEVMAFASDAFVPIGGRAPGTLSLESRASERRGLPRGESAVSHSFVVHNQRERLLDALANLSAAEGYGEVTIPEVVHEAAVSVQAFYEHFSGKDDAFCVAYELGQRKLLAITERAYESHIDWPSAIRSGLGAMLDFYASEPSFARIGLVDSLTCGAKIDQLSRAGDERLAEIVRPGLQFSHDGVQRVEIMVEGTVTALQDLCYVYAANERAREMSVLLDLATHVALAPFVGVRLAETEQRASRIAHRPSA
ncbi:MAG: TetR/AcrR family transcriptional regulator [Solirubrobacteraceae bacterium]